MSAHSISFSALNCCCCSTCFQCHLAELYIRFLFLIISKPFLVLIILYMSSISLLIDCCSLYIKYVEKILEKPLNHPVSPLYLRVFALCQHRQNGLALTAMHFESLLGTVLYTFTQVLFSLLLEPILMLLNSPCIVFWTQKSLLTNKSQKAALITKLKRFYSIINEKSLFHFLSYAQYIVLF